MPRYVSAVGPNLVTDEGSGQFTVCSADSDNVYTIEISVPACTCFDWQKHHLPCKHMLAVFHIYPAWGWDSLPSSYRDFAHFHLDPEIIGSAPTEHLADLLKTIPAAADLASHSVDSPSAADLACHSVDSPSAGDLAHVPENGVPADNVACLSQDRLVADSEHVGGGDVSECTSKLQSRVRQLMQLISSYTYMTSDDSLLSETVDTANELLHKFKAVVPRLCRARVNSRRRFAKANIQATYLKRRLHAIRAKRALKRKRRKYQAMQGFSHSLHV